MKEKKEVSIQVNGRIFSEEIPENQTVDKVYQRFKKALTDPEVDFVSYVSGVGVLKADSIDAVWIDEVEKNEDDSE